MTTDTTIPIEYRTWTKGNPPRRTKLDVGGWAGENTWKSPQSWHCKPFSDATTYGLELVYPWETTCEVTCDIDGKCKFSGDFSAEKPEGVDKTWEPFGAFAPFHFGYVSMLDIKTPKDHGLMVGPHPRIFSDRDGSTPIAVPGLLEMDWWPEVFFIVFKAPLPGCKTVFRKGDGVAQFTVVPKNIKYDIKEMANEDKHTRAKRQSNLEKNWNRMCSRVFYCENGVEFFDNKYKVLSQVARREGIEKAEEYLDDPTKMPDYKKNPAVVDHRPEGERPMKHCPFKEKKPKEPVVKIEEINNDPEPKAKVNKYEPPVLPQDFWQGVPQEDDSDLIADGLGDLEEIISKTEDFTKLSDGEMNDIITSFKMRKRQVRKKRSLELKAESTPTTVKTEVKQNPKKQSGERVLGHKMEKLL